MKCGCVRIVGGWYAVLVVIWMYVLVNAALIAILLFGELLGQMF